MQPILSLDEFFTRSGAEVSLYHMGRRVIPCHRETLRAFENGELAWPEPWQGHARVGVLFRLGNMPEPAIWFLSLPLDELGMLVPAQRDAFINRLLETLGSNAASVQNDALEPQATANIHHLMQDNPLAFTPDVTFQAMFNAKATLALDLPASQHFELVEDYVSGQQKIDWQVLGLQGIADYAVRLDPAAASMLADKIGDLPTQVLHSLCYCLEHQPLLEPLLSALCLRGEKAASQGDLETLCACIRAVGSTREPKAGNWYTELLQDQAVCGPDVLAAIAGRGWPLLEDAERLPLFLQRLAEDKRTQFKVAIQDIALVPRLRLPVMMTLRNAPAESAIHKRLAKEVEHR